MFTGAAVYALTGPLQTPYVFMLLSYVMLCCFMLCYVMLSYVMLYSYVMLLCCVLLSDVCYVLFLM